MLSKKRKRIGLTLVMISLVFFLGTGCKGKRRSQGKEENPILRNVKIGMYKGEVEEIYGHPLQTWENESCPLPFLRDVGDVWIYSNPFPGSAPAKTFLFFDNLDKLLAIDRNGRGIPEETYPVNRGFLVESRGNRVYLRDVSAQAFDFDSLWTSESMAKGMTTAPGLIGIVTRNGGYIPLSVEIAAAPPGRGDTEGWRFTQDAVMVIAGSTLVIEGELFDPLGWVDISPGTYRVRIYVGDGSAPDPGNLGLDFYWVRLWPEAVNPLSADPDAGEAGI